MLPERQEIPGGTSGISVFQGWGDGLFTASMGLPQWSPLPPCWQARCDTEGQHTSPGRSSPHSTARRTLPTHHLPDFHHFTVCTFSSIHRTQCEEIVFSHQYKKGLLGLGSGCSDKFGVRVQGHAVCSQPESLAPSLGSTHWLHRPVGARGWDFSFTFCSLVWQVTSLWKMTAAFCTLSLFPAPSMLVSIFQRSRVIPANNGCPCWTAAGGPGTEPPRDMWPKPQSSQVPTSVFFSASHRVKTKPQHFPPDPNMILWFEFTTTQIWHLLFGCLWFWETFFSFAFFWSRMLLTTNSDEIKSMILVLLEATNSGKLPIK